MNIYYRIMLAVYAFLSIIVSFFAMLVIVRNELFKAISGYVENEILPNGGISFVIFLIAFIFFILSFIFLLSGVRSTKDKKEISKHTNVGEIKISLNTIESIALAASKKLSGVRDSKTHVKKLEDSVLVTVRVVVLPDINIPSLSEDIQVRVKKSIEECSGINVDNVKVIVENIYSGYKSRVE